MRVFCVALHQAAHTTFHGVDFRDRRFDDIGDAGLVQCFLERGGIAGPGMRCLHRFRQLRQRLGLKGDHQLDVTHALAPRAIHDIGCHVAGRGGAAEQAEGSEEMVVPAIAAGGHEIAHRPHIDQRAVQPRVGQGILKRAMRRDTRRVPDQCAGHGVHAMSGRGGGANNRLGIGRTAQMIMQVPAFRHAI